MKKGILGFVSVVLVIAIISVVAINGLNLGKFKIPSASEGIVLGLDLQGGASIVFEARPEDGVTVTEADMEVAQTVLQRRLQTMKYTEATVQIMGTNRLSVEIPSVTDPEKAVADLGKTAVLEFRDADGNVILNGMDVKKATASYGEIGELGEMGHHVSLEFSSEGAKKFSKATSDAAGKAAEGKNYIAIYLDEDMVSMPEVTRAITEPQCMITMGQGSSEALKEEAGKLADYINSGRLPFALEEIQLRAVGPTLGDKALETSLFAGAIGLVLVMLFMIAIYRLSGVVASISLVFYTVLMMVVLSVSKVNLSLPGIAGIILSIGMAVDANVIIYERIKEELRVGKTLKASIDSGFKRAFTAILDSNVTTLIAAVVLYKFGMGTVVGFAITLGIGVVLSMFTVLIVSRFLLYRLVDMKIKSIKAYGA